MAKKQFIAYPTPSGYLQRMFKHKGDVSEGAKSKIIATRKILGREVIFFQNGLRFIKGLDLTEQEQFDSEILRLAHASILIQGPVGDKKSCYVDAVKNPIEVWIYGKPLSRFIREYTHRVRTGEVEVDFLLNEHVKRTVEKTNE